MQLKSQMHCVVIDRINAVDGMMMRSQSAITSSRQTESLQKTRFGLLCWAIPDDRQTAMFLYPFCVVAPISPSSVTPIRCAFESILMISGRTHCDTHQRVVFEAVSAKVFNCVAEDFDAVAFAAETSASPLGVLSREEESFRMRHQSEDSAGCITQSGDVGD